MPGDVGQDSAHLKLEQSKAHLEEELLFHISKDKNTRGLFWVRDVLLGHNQPTVVTGFVGSTSVSSWHHCPGPNTAARARLTTW